MWLREALGIRRGDVVAFIGAGGKTSALFRVAQELRANGWSVLATTTTRLAWHEVQQAPFVAQFTSTVTPAMIREWLHDHGFVFLYGLEDSWRDKAIGLSPDRIAPLVDSVTSDVLLIEADGARRLPLKAPYDHEPVIPPDTSLVVPVAGIDVLGQPLDGQHVYNAQRISERYGFPEGGIVIPPWMAVTVRDPELGLRGVPESARVVALLNKVPPGGYDRVLARRVARLVLRNHRIDAVALGAVQAPDPVHEIQRRVAAVILAAGQSSRMGQSKMLLPWDGRSVVEAVVSRAISARLSETVVVTGYQGEAVTRALDGLPVQIVDNPHYRQGEMLSSLQAGLRALPDTIAACLVMLGDQPAISARTIGQVLAAYAERKGDIVRPVFQGQAGHPILIDRRFWPELLELSTGMPRDVIRRHPDDLALADVDTDSILSDIDTPEQYQRERRRAGLH